jgi:hypothetical protein
MGIHGQGEPGRDDAAPGREPPGTAPASIGPRLKLGRHHNRVGGGGAARAAGIRRGVAVACLAAAGVRPARERGRRRVAVPQPLQAVQAGKAGSGVAGDEHRPGNSLSAVRLPRWCHGVAARGWAIQGPGAGMPPPPAVVPRCGWRRVRCVRCAIHGSRCMSIWEPSAGVDSVDPCQPRWERGHRRDAAWPGHRPAKAALAAGPAASMPGFGPGRPRHPDGTARP